MQYKIEKGDTFKCIKTFKMEDGTKEYLKGREYISEVDNCITDEGLDVFHNMSDLPEFFKYFKLL